MNLVERFNSLKESVFDFPKNMKELGELKKLVSSKLKASVARSKLTGIYGTDELYDAIFDIVDSGNKDKDVSNIVIKSIKKSSKKIKPSKELQDVINKL